METQLLQQQIAISILRASGNKKLKSLLDSGGKLEDFFGENKKSDYSSLNKYQFASPSKRKNALIAAEGYLKYFNNQELELLYYQGDNYPYRLEECQDAPITLYKKGNFDLNTTKVVAIVGTRSITDYGRKICEDLIRSFVNKNILVISGLAFGVDVFTHTLCIEYGVPTVGVLGHGFNFMYPAQHRGIAKKMQENGGLVTEFLPDVHPDKIHFPMRNRIIAGLADATIVVESSQRGGSLITADLANSYNRDVFAFPGRITDEHSQGCNQLIKNNRAILINSGEEFLEMMNWSNSSKTTKSKPQPDLFDRAENLSEHEKKVFQFIKKKNEVFKDEIIYTFQEFSTELFGILLNLEMNNYIKLTPSGKYRCCI